MPKEESLPLIDFSHAKEPQSTIDSNSEEAAPLEEPQKKDVGENQVIIANIPNGGTLPSQVENLP